MIQREAQQFNRALTYLDHSPDSNYPRQALNLAIFHCHASSRPVRHTVNSKASLAHTMDTDKASEGSILRWHFTTRMSEPNSFECMAINSPIVETALRVSHQGIIETNKVEELTLPTNPSHLIDAARGNIIAALNLLLHSCRAYRDITKDERRLASLKHCKTVLGALYQQPRVIALNSGGLLYRLLNRRRWRWMSNLTGRESGY